MSVRVPGKRRRGRPPKNALISMGSNGALVPCNGRDAVNEMQVSLKKVTPKSLSYRTILPMLDAIALEGAGVVGPSHHDLRGWTLKSAVNDVKADMDYLVPDVSPYVTNFRTVKRIVDLKHNLQERLVPDTKFRIKIIKELTSYKTAAGDFGRKMAVRARESLLPSEWWSTYGGACPNLSRLAIRILSQCCSLTHCKKDLTTLEQMHNTVNSLETSTTQRSGLHSKSKEHDNTDPLSVDNHASVADWITRKELCLDDHGSSDWMAIELPSPSKMRLKSSIDEVSMIMRFFGGAKDEDDALVDNTEGQ
ncbi:Vacuolar-sorting protein SNF8 [Bienertia sinuspersici]